MDHVLHLLVARQNVIFYITFLLWILLDNVHQKRNGTPNYKNNRRRGKKLFRIATWSAHTTSPTYFYEYTYAELAAWDSIWIEFETRDNNVKATTNKKNKTRRGRWHGTKNVIYYLLWVQSAVERDYIINNCAGKTIHLFSVCVCTERRLLFCIDIGSVDVHS